MSEQDIEEIVQHMERIIVTLRSCPEILEDSPDLGTIFHLIDSYTDFITVKNLDDLENGFFDYLEEKAVEILHPEQIKVYDITLANQMSNYVTIKAALMLRHHKLNPETARSVYRHEFAMASAGAYNNLLDKVGKWYDTIFDRMCYGIVVLPCDIKIVDDIYSIIRENKFLDERKVRSVNRTRRRF
jgi:hypothetical protein